MSLHRRFFTVLILRDAGRRFRKLRVSYVFGATCAALVLSVGLAGLFMPRYLLGWRDASVALERLQEENRRLERERDGFQTELSRVSDQLDTIEGRALQLAEELGLEQDAEFGGAGGPAAGTAPRERFWFETEVRALDSRSQYLDRSVDELGVAFRERMEQLSATPNTMPVEGWFSHGYGWRRDPFSGQREFHRGIDIVAPANTEIVAPADGVVSRSGRYAELGRSLDVAHGYGFVTRYAHLSELLVRPGDRVRRGDVIGRVGSTGRSTGPHLHYEIFRDGRRVNPWTYLGQQGS